jgi:hypothetical protein
VGSKPPTALAAGTPATNLLRFIFPAKLMGSCWTTWIHTRSLRPSPRAEYDPQQRGSGGRGDPSRSADRRQPSLASALAAYLDLYPNVNVDLTLSDRPVDLVEEGYEAAFRIGHWPIQNSWPNR